MSSRNDPRARGWRRWSIALVGAFGLLFSAGTGLVAAHATLVSSDPTDGSTLAAAPGELRLTFSELVSVDLSIVHLIDGDGGRVDSVRIDADPTDGRTLVVRLPELETGIYRLEWRVVDGSDLHVTESSLVFGLRQAAVRAEPAGAAEANGLETATAFVDHALQAAIVGAFAISLANALPFRPRRRDQPLVARRKAGPTDPGGVMGPRLRRFATIATADALLSGLVLLVVQTSAIAADRSLGPVVVAVLVTWHGFAWLARQGILLLLLALAMRDRTAGSARLESGPLEGGARDRSGPAGSRPLLTLGLLVGLALAAALAGHVNVGDPAETTVRLIALAAHDLAAAAWVGGLLVLAVVGGPMLGRPAERAAARRMLQSFAWVAAPSAAVLAISGIYLAGQMVATADALGSTTYGQSLLLKTLVVGLLAGLGASHALSLHRPARSVVRRVVPAAIVRRITTARPTRGLRIEAAAGLVVVLLAASLGATPPARGAGFDPTDETAPPAGTASRADDLLISFVVRPNQPGRNFASIGVFDTRRPQPAPIEAVAVQIIDPSGRVGPFVIAEARGGGRYEAVLPDIANAGAWRIEVVVERAGIAPARLAGSWTVGPPAGDRNPPPGAIRLAPIATPAAAIGCLLVIAILLGIAFRRERRGTTAASRARAHGRSIAPSVGGSS